MVYVIAYAGLIAATLGAVAVRLKCVAYSTEVGIAFIAATLLFAILTAVWATRKTVKTNHKRYLFLFFIPIVVFLAQIIFRQQIWDIWQQVFVTFPGPGTLPESAMLV